MEHNDALEHPNSLGFWRRNEIAALRMTFAGVTAALAATPEEYEFIKEQRQRLATLEAREQQIAERYLRIQGRSL